MCTDWLKIGFLQLDGDRTSTLMAQAKRIYILIIKVNKLFKFPFSGRGVL